MSLKICAARRRAFLKAFAQSGNVTLSAAEAGVSRWWVRLTRRSDPAFDAQCRAAKEAAAARLAGGERNRPPEAWEQRGGVDLVVTRAGKRAPQVTRARGAARWTPRAEDRFLGQLRLYNNIAAACAATGMTISSYEAHARRWPEFRRRVREARETGSLLLRLVWAAERGRPSDLSEDRGCAASDLRGDE